MRQIFPINVALHTINIKFTPFSFLQCNCETDLLDLLLELGELVVQLPLPELHVPHPQLQLHLHLNSKGICQKKEREEGGNVDWSK